VPEWADGTAVYYWFTDPIFGAPHWLSPVLTPLLMNPVTVTMLTWGAILLEVFLFTGLVMDKKHRKQLLLCGIAFHAGIAVIHGLISFAIAMWAALLLYLRSPSDQLVLPGELRRLTLRQTRHSHEPNLIPTDAVAKAATTH
jgi:antimicrobial peptide system SdpB family protein